jgi:AraC-like DNA-binding protein
MQDAVARAIDVMWERYGEPISLSDLADAAILSRFYFSRVFRSTTGTSPGRFLSAIRLHSAKSLLLESTMSVTDISYHVGYNSPGTFTSRFTRSVGIAPTRYRELPRNQPAAPLTAPQGHGDPSVCGSLEIPASGVPLRVYVGAFSTPIPEGLPVACDIIDCKARRFALYGVPDGVWHIRATAVGCTDLHTSPSKRRPLFVGGGAQGVHVQAGRIIESDIVMHRMSVFDIPILLAIPELYAQEPPLTGSPLD